MRRFTQAPVFRTTALLHPHRRFDIPPPPPGASPASVVSHPAAVDDPPARPRVESFGGLGALPPPPAAPTSKFVVAPANPTSTGATIQIQNTPRKKLAEPGSEEAGTTLTLQMLAQHAPSFFVPMQRVLAEMPGYTEEHLKALFGATRVVECLAFGPTSDRVLRIFGARGWTLTVDLFDEGAVAARERHAAFAVDPALCEYFLPAFARPGQWVPLQLLVQNAEESQRARIPFDGPDSMAFFSQMQHIFAVDTESRDGRVAIPPRQPDHLSWDTTPLPTVLQEVFRLIDANPTPAPDLFALLSEESRALVVAFYAVEERIDAKRRGAPVPADNPTSAPPTADESQCFDSAPDGVPFDTGVLTVGHRSGEPSRVVWRWTVESGTRMLERFVATHSPTLGIKAGTRLVMKRNEIELESRKSLPLEEQLHLARDRGDTKSVRALKKKMLMLANPDNPLLEEDKLATAILEFLPPDKPILLTSLKRVLPQDIIDLLPSRNPIKFWKRHEATLWTVVELGRVGKLALQRKGLDIPHGALRSEGSYDEAESCRIIGEVLATSHGAVKVMVLQRKLPLGLQNQIKESHGGVAQFAQKHPEFFAVVLFGNDARNAMVSLVAMPH